MTELLITMNPSGTFSFLQNPGRIEEYCARRLKITLNEEFLSSSISYYTLSFEPYSLSRKIITENIYRDSSTSEGIYYADGCIFCPVYDYIAVSPVVAVQIDGYETDSSGNVTAIIKSGIFNLEFAPSLTGEGMMLETVRPDVKFFQNVSEAVDRDLETRVISGDNLESYSVTGRKIALETISTVHLQDYAVTTIKIKNDAVKTNCIADENITCEKLAPASVTEEKIAENAVTTDKISDNSVTASKLADGSVSNTKLANYSIGESKIRPLSVSTSKIADAAVTPAKLDREYITHHQSLEGYATEDWVRKQNYITDDINLEGFATEDWVKAQNYLTEHQDLYGYATEDWVKAQNYLTEHQSLEGYATEDWVEDRNYLTEHQSLEGYATEDWVKKQNYISDDISLEGYATEDWVKEQNYLTEHQSLDGYATEDWVESKGYLTSTDGFLKEENVPKKLSGFVNDVAVSFNTQVLTDEQKQTARDNIGAVKTENGKSLSQNDFTDEYREKLDAALTEHQDISMKADVSSLSAVSFSGSYNDLSDLPENCGFTEELKVHYDEAYAHSLTSHAPSDAEKNIIESVTLNGKTAEIKEKNVSINFIDFEEKEIVFAEVY